MHTFAVHYVCLDRRHGGHPAAPSEPIGVLVQAAIVLYDRDSRPRDGECHQSSRRSPNSSVAQWQSIRLLTGGLLVRVQPEEPNQINHLR